MEENVWMHYCEDPRSKRFVLCNINNLKEVTTWRFNVPYDSLYCFNSVQINNLIFFTGGGNPASESSPEQFYQIIMRITVMPSMEVIADKLANMKVPRANHAMEAIGNKKLYVVGGSNSSGYIDSCEEYDINANSWREIASLNEKKKWLSLCHFKDRFLYAIGGCINDEHKGSCLIECLDTTNPMKKKWDIIKLDSGSGLTKSAFFVGLMNIFDSCILLFGGVLKSEEENCCFAFDPIKKTLEEQKGLLKRDSFYRTRYGVNGKNFAIVGCRDGDLHIYDIETKKWDLMVRKIWNPNYEITIKADTF